MMKNAAATGQAAIWNVQGHKQEKEASERLALPETAEELQRLLQTEADKRVTQALNTAHEKWEKKLEAETERAAKEARLLAEEALRQEAGKLQDRYRRELKEMERALKQKELEIRTVDLLAERKLPVEFKEFISGSDEESTIKRVNDFLKIWQIKLEEAVKLSLPAIR